MQLEGMEPGQGEAFSLRNARRARGLTQKDLAKLLGVTQARISQWESGREEIPARQVGCLIDIFENRGDRIGPLLDRMLRRDPMLSVQSENGEYLIKECEAVCQAYRLHAPDVNGRPHAATFEAKWKDTDPRIPMQEEILSIEYERDISLAHGSGGKTEFRVYVEMFAIDFAGYGRVWLRRNKLIKPATGAPLKHHNNLLISDLDT